MALMYLPLYLFLLGICSAFLWLPALGVGIGLLVLRPSCRRKLGVLFGLWGLSMVLLLGTAWAESNVSVRLRNWVYTVPVYFWGAVSIVLLIAVAWYAVQHFPAKWIGCLVKIGCALSVFAVFFGGIFLFGVDYPDGRGGNLAGAAGSYAEVFLSGCHLLLLPLQWALPAGRISGVVRNPMGYSRVQMTQLGVLILGAIGRS